MASDAHPVRVARRQEQSRRLPKCTCARVNRNAVVLVELAVAATVSSAQELDSVKAATDNHHNFHLVKSDALLRGVYSRAKPKTLPKPILSYGVVVQQTFCW